ncbi:MAG: 4-hydroxy-3-methylbut-2-enyl diphosphate reductase [Rikenellaceae bacterium]
MIVDIDEKSGFCPGVVTAINQAEEELLKGNSLYCLGDLMHNKVEMGRLHDLGLTSITMDEFNALTNDTVLIRAHGEPPATYEKAKQNNIKIIDATCKVVASIQRLVRRAYEQMKPIGGQVIILGKKGHPEVIGLAGQVDDGRAIIVEKMSDLYGNVDFSKPIYFLSQTTKSLGDFKEVKDTIIEETSKLGNKDVTIKDTICRQVANRYEHLQEFSKKYDVILFVSGKDSSNGKALYENCLEVNTNCYKIENSSQIDWSKLEGVEKIGICGATSTPKWLMEQVKNDICSSLKNKNI